MLLRLESIAKSYGNRLIFKNISMEIKSGQTTLLAGPNGAGKSTLLKIMAGLEKQDSGQLTRNFKNFSEIGYLGHQTFIYPGLSASENLHFWSKMYQLSCSRKDIILALKKVELEQFIDERAGTFSRGMAQRLNLARILLQQPRILLLDEPASGLDTRSRLLLAEEIKNAGEQGVGIVWITHSLKEDAAGAAQLAVLENKTLTYLGPPDKYAGLKTEQVC